MLTILASTLLSVSLIQDLYVDGYVNGQPEQILVSKIPGYDIDQNELLINIKAKQDLIQMIEDSAKQGIYLKINYAFRDYRAQAAIKKRNPRLAAKPGKSPHQEGLSIDISGTKNKRKYTITYFWLINNAHKYNFYQPMQNESWHWSWKENGQNTSNF